MNDPIVDFINVLNDNEFKSKVCEIPDEFDNRDELLAEMDMMDIIPASMIYFELNGFSSPVDLEEFLEKEYNRFKIALFSFTGQNKDLLLIEIKGQIAKTNKSLAQLISSVKHIGDETFNSLLKLKLHYLGMTLDFINSQDYHEIQNNSEDCQSTSVKEIKPVHVFEINKESSITSKYALSQMHKELVKAGYIDCRLAEFRKLFIQFGDKKPNQTPQPIVWYSRGYSCLAYFIHCITESFLTDQASLHNKAASKLFYNNKRNKAFDVARLRFSGKVNSIDEKRIDDMIKRLKLTKQGQNSNDNRRQLRQI